MSALHSITAENAMQTNPRNLLEFPTTELMDRGQCCRQKLINESILTMPLNTWEVALLMSDLEIIHIQLAI